jgi:hypothetical protein
MAEVMVKIALVRPNTDSGLVVSPHLGLGYIESYLKSKGHEVKLFDGLRDQLPYNKIALDVLDYSPDFVGITATTALYSSIHSRTT